MRIAQISTLASPVCLGATHSIEQLVWLLTEELIKLGHEVTLFAAEGSSTSGHLVATLPGPYAAPGSLGNWQTCEWVNLCQAVEVSGEFDVLHSHGYLWGLPLEALTRTPIVHTLHVQPHDDEARLWSRVPGACVTAISAFQWSAYPELKPAAVIHHGIDPSQFEFEMHPQDHVCYLGRFLPAKGAVEAILTARKLGLRLVLAGPRSEFFSEQVEPLIDGQLIKYIGPVDKADRNRLLGGSRALLYTIREPEPFGLVQIESMMCGTPVAAIRIGAVPEIIDEDVTGACADGIETFHEAIDRALRLDRAGVRAQAVARFSASRMARQYAELYQEIIERRKHIASPQHSTKRSP